VAPASRAAIHRDTVHEASLATQRTRHRGDGRSVGQHARAAISSVEANAGPQFNFVNPGARSLGMAGAFIGLADDSTAAYTNPAGWASSAARNSRPKCATPSSPRRASSNGRLIGAPSGQGRDTIAGLNTQSDTEGVANIFVPVVRLPALARLARRYRTSSPTSRRISPRKARSSRASRPSGNVTNVSRVPPSVNDIDLQSPTTAFAGSWRINDKFMLGGSLNYYSSTSTR
jgi:hypothetical protein